MYIYTALVALTDNNQVNSSHFTPILSTPCLASALAFLVRKKVHTEEYQVINFVIYK